MRKTSQCSRYFRGLILVAAFLFYACTPPDSSSSGGDGGSKTGSGGTNPAQTYTTTVSGTVITPGRTADPTKGSFIGTASVYASTEPSKKVAVNTADGSYSLNVTHKGSFNLTAEYTGTDSNYNTSDAKTVSTKAESMGGQNIALKYGRTIKLQGTVAVFDRSGNGQFRNNIEVTAEVEGFVVARDTSGSGTSLGSYIINAPHNGSLTIKAEFSGKEPVAHAVPSSVILNRRTYNYAVELRP